MNIDGTRDKKHQKLHIENNSIPMSPDASNVASPTADILGENTKIRLRNHVSLKSIEAERQISSMEKGYMCNQKFETNANTSLVGYEKKIPGVLISNASSEIIDENSNVSQSQVGSKKEDSAFDNENAYGLGLKTKKSVDNDIPKSGQVEGTSAAIEKSMNKFVYSLQSVRRVESILQSNPGNIQRKKPITLGKSELDTLTSNQRSNAPDDDKLEVQDSDGTIIKVTNKEIKRLD